MKKKIDCVVLQTSFSIAPHKSTCTELDHMHVNISEVILRKIFKFRIITSSSVISREVMTIDLGYIGFTELTVNIISNTKLSPKISTSNYSYFHFRKL